LCLLISMLFVFVSAASTLFLTWAVVVGPALAERLQPDWAKQFLETPLVGSVLHFFERTWLSPLTRYALAGAVIALQLFAFHLWLAAGRRRFQDVWPGVVLSIALWLAIAALWSKYLAITNYSLFYAGLSQLMIAMIFFQVTAIAVLIGAELNRGIMEVKKMRRAAAQKAAVYTSSPS
jgi:membrane protein